MRLSIPLLLLCLICWWRPPVLTQAQGGRFTSEAEVVFGQRIDFTLTGMTDLPVTAVTLTIQPAGQAESHVAAVPFAQAADGALTAVFPLPPQQVRLSPLTTLTYAWQIQTATGEWIEVPAKAVAYEDDRFEWKQLTAVTGLPVTSVTVRWTDDSLTTGETASRLVAETVQRLQPVLPIASGTPIPVLVYPSSADLRAALRLNGHEWTGQHADPGLGLVMVTAVNPRTAAEELGRNLPHELSHYLLYQAAGPAYDEMPYWFKEGLAVWAEDEQGGKEEQAMLVATAVANQATISLVSLCGPGPFTDEALAAAQSASLVQYVQRRYGERGLSGLADAFIAGEDCATAVPAGLGQSLAELEVSWLAAQQPQPPWQRFLTENALWFLLLLGSFFIMVLLLRPAGR